MEFGVNSVNSEFLNWYLKFYNVDPNPTMNVIYITSWLICDVLTPFSLTKGIDIMVMVRG